MRRGLHRYGIDLTAGRETMGRRLPAERSQNEIAEQLGVTRLSVRWIEGNGRCPRGDQAKRGARGIADMPA